MRHTTRLKRLNELKYVMDNHDTLFKTVEFDIGSWCESEHPSLLPKEARARNHGSSKIFKAEKIPAACGTAACALGSAALYAPFMKKGLRLTNLQNGAPIYKDTEGFEAGEEFFGITGVESYYLFDPRSYEDEHEDTGDILDVTPAMVSARVQELIEKYHAIAFPA